jgi:hypothetical protein
MKITPLSKILFFLILISCHACISTTYTKSSDLSPEIVYAKMDFIGIYVRKEKPEYIKPISERLMEDLTKRGKIVLSHTTLDSLLSSDIKAKIENGFDEKTAQEVYKVLKIKYLWIGSVVNVRDMLGSGVDEGHEATFALEIFDLENFNRLALIETGCSGGSQPVFIFTFRTPLEDVLAKAASRSVKRFDKDLKALIKKK